MESTRLFTNALEAAYDRGDYLLRLFLKHELNIDLGKRDLMSTVISQNRTINEFYDDPCAWLQSHQNELSILMCADKLPESPQTNAPEDQPVPIIEYVTPLVDKTVHLIGNGELDIQRTKMSRLPVTSIHNHTHHKSIAASEYEYVTLLIDNTLHPIGNGELAIQRIKMSRLPVTSIHNQTHHKSIAASDIMKVYLVKEETLVHLPIHIARDVYMVIDRGRLVKKCHSHPHLGATDNDQLNKNPALDKSAYQIAIEEHWFIVVHGTLQLFTYVI